MNEIAAMLRGLLTYRHRLKVRLLRPDGALIGDYRDYDHAVEVLGREFISRGEYQIAPVPDAPEASEVAL